MVPSSANADTDDTFIVLEPLVISTWKSKEVDKFVFLEFLISFEILYFKSFSIKAFMFSGVSIKTFFRVYLRDNTYDRWGLIVEVDQSFLSPDKGLNRPSEIRPS